MLTMQQLTAAEEKRWAAMQIDPRRIAIFEQVASRLIKPDNKKQFIAVSNLTSVPWWVIAVIKEREAGADPKWMRSIAQGDPWQHVSVHIPAGRGPFKNWTDAAVDALANCAPHAAKWGDWSAGGTLMILQMYNGLGYARGPIDRSVLPNRQHPPMASPYIWAGTNQYVKGKYVADKRFDPNAVDQQLGCAGLIKQMMELDSSIQFK